VLGVVVLVLVAGVGVLAVGGPVAGAARACAVSRVFGWLVAACGLVVKGAVTLGQRAVLALRVVVLGLRRSTVAALAGPAAPLHLTWPPRVHNWPSPGRQLVLGWRGERLIVAPSRGPLTPLQPVLPV
jgi:hypothetical protein